MNIGVSESEEEYFSIEDIIVSYSNIEITPIFISKLPYKKIKIQK